MNAQKHTCDQCGKESVDSAKEGGWIRITSGAIFRILFSDGKNAPLVKTAKAPLDLCSTGCVEKFFTPPAPKAKPAGKPSTP